ncbi:hypothetical protein PR048_004976 [Dryococelus australis]|uniref:Uncharacterized protein n=1 Tax=Dryococelus australis TaxID=614101 RepID=A0ABQ9I6X3_9NEOP|nr:hypothetical protein PR048_004976 [Dryococelus australis]
MDAGFCSPTFLVEYADIHLFYAAENVTYGVHHPPPTPEPHLEKGSLNCCSRHVSVCPLVHLDGEPFHCSLWAGLCIPSQLKFTSDINAVWSSAVSMMVIPNGAIRSFTIHFYHIGTRVYSKKAVGACRTAQSIELALSEVAILKPTDSSEDVKHRWENIKLCSSHHWIALENTNSQLSIISKIPELRATFVAISHIPVLAKICVDYKLVEMEVDTGSPNLGSSFVPLLGQSWLDALFPSWKQQWCEMIQLVVEKEEATANCGSQSKDLTNSVQYALKGKIERQLKQLQSRNVIFPVKDSDWASPVVAVPKKNGQLRLCVDLKIFLLKTDHQLLKTICSPDKGIPTLATSRLQRWAIILQAYNYQIQYCKETSTGPADTMSRLPTPTAVGVEVVKVFAASRDFLPVTHQELARETQREDVLAKDLVVMYATISVIKEKKTFCSFDPNVPVLQPGNLGTETYQVSQVQNYQARKITGFREKEICPVRPNPELRNGVHISGLHRSSREVVPPKGLIKEALPDRGFMVHEYETPTNHVGKVCDAYGSVQP